MPRMPEIRRHLRRGIASRGTIRAQAAREAVRHRARGPEWNNVPWGNLEGPRLSDRPDQCEALEPLSSLPGCGIRLAKPKSILTFAVEGYRSEFRLFITGVSRKGDGQRY